jgi:hypothetical protein
VHKLSIFSILFFSMLPSYSFAQDVIEELSKFIGLVYHYDSSGSIHSGTGSLIATVLSKEESLVLLITNKHVLPKLNQNDSIHLAIANDSDSINHFVDIKIPIYKSGRVLPHVKFDPDSNDLVVINVSRFVASQALFLTKGLFNQSFFIPRDSLNKYRISLGDEVLFIGYPSWFFDQRNFSPLVRSGIVATDPKKDYYFSSLYRRINLMRSGELLPEKLTGFLMDANVFQGSSGSLVFTIPRLEITADGALTSTRDISIIGILAFSYLDVTSSLPDGRINLGGVISANQILKVIELFRKEYALKH